MAGEAPGISHDTTGWATYLDRLNLYSEARRLDLFIDIVRRHAPNGGSLLEVGFGSGCTAILLADAGYRVTAIDLDRAVIARFRSRYRDLSSRLTILQADMAHLPFVGTAQFDVVYHQGVLEHFDDESIVHALREQARVAKIVVFDVPNDRCPYRSYGDERLLSNEHWLGLIESAGLHCIETWGRMPRMPAWVGALLPHILFATRRQRLAILGRLFGENSIFVCKPIR